MVVVDDGLNIVKKKAEKRRKKQGGIRTSIEQPARINKVIMEEDGQKC